MVLQQAALRGVRVVVEGGMDGAGAAVAEGGPPAGRLYEVFVSENTPAGSVVVTVDAVDEDDADNGLVEYQSTTLAGNN